MKLPFSSFYLTFIFVFHSVLLYGENNYSINGKVFIDNGSTDNVLVDIYSNGELVKKLSVNQDGLFRTTIDWNQIYSISFSKKGYVTKIIEFSTILPSGKNSTGIEPYNLRVRLFKTFEGVDSVFFKNPVAKIRYDQTIGDFDYDMDYSLSVKYKVDEMMKNAKESSHKSEVTKTVRTKQNSSVPPKSEVFKDSGYVVLTETGNVTTVPDIPHTGHGSIDNNELPPLKEYYPPGRTIEEYDLPEKKITRIVIMRGNTRNIYFRVKHNWGPVYYFHDETPLTYRCITRKAYERETGIDEPNESKK